MSEKNSRDRPSRNPPVELSVEHFKPKKSSVKSKKKPTLRLQKSKPPKNAVKIQPKQISIHFRWALILTITCFFVIGPCWALYKTRQLRRLLAESEFEKASQLSSKISSTLVISTIIGCFAWVSFLFCSIGLVLTGFLLDKGYI